MRGRLEAAGSVSVKRAIDIARLEIMEGHPASRGCRLMHREYLPVFNEAQYLEAKREDRDSISRVSAVCFE